MARGQLGDLDRAGGEQRIGANDQRAGTLSGKSSECVIEIAFAGYGGDVDLQSKSASPGFDILEQRLGHRRAGAYQHGD